jgi:peptidoglycan/LPS O-acetylase OafA/YrhL
LIVPLALRLKPSQLLLGAACAWCIAIAIHLVTAPYAGYQIVGQSLPDFVQTWPPFRLPDFLIGVLLGRLYMLRRTESPAKGLGILTVASLFACVAIIQAQPTLPIGMVEKLLLAPFGALVYSLAASPSSTIARFLAHRWLLLLGGASYAIYLLHFPANQYGRSIFAAIGRRADTPVYALIYMIVVILISIGVFLWYEEPARRYLRRRLGGRLARPGDSLPGP